MNRSNNPLRVLKVNASGRSKDSVSRMLSGELVDALEQHNGRIDLVHRNLSDGVSLIDEQWIEANFTATEDRTPSQRARLAESDVLVRELQDSDVIVIGVPVYNFGIPAALKAWVDLIARARLTFRYTESGPEGLLRGKTAFLVVASGGVPIDSPVDFATPYMRQALAFVGIDAIQVIAADQLNSREADSIDSARSRIAELVYTSEAPADKVA